MKLTLSDSMSERIAAPFVKNGFGDAEQYIESLGDGEWQRAASDALDELLIEGGEAINLTPEFWDMHKRRCLKRFPDAALYM